MKDVVFMTALATERCDPNFYIKEYTEWSIKSWKYWCSKNNAHLFVFNQSNIDTDVMMPTWQRWLCYDILDAQDWIGKYNRVLLVDADTMVRWDCPNIFDAAEGRYAGVKDDLGLGWTYHSILGYQKWFPNIKLDWERYINNGIVVLPEDGVGGRNFCGSIINFYNANREALRWMEKNDYRGTDQTPVNFIAENMFGDRKKFLPKKFNMNHMHKTDILYNFMYIDMGYIWHFNGLPTADRNNIMKSCWNKVKDNYGRK